MLRSHLLSLLIFIPILGSALALAIGGNKYPTRARWLALLSCLISGVICFYLYRGFNEAQSGMQFQESFQWISSYHIYYALGVDGISLPLIFLTVFTTLVVILASWKSVNLRVAQYLAAFLVTQSMMIGTFAATDAMSFYVFWEGMLIPMYLSIGVWGSTERSYASIKFFLYTFFGSALMLIALLYLASRTTSLNFSITSYYSLKLTFTEQIGIFLAFFIAFAVKIPMWPVHTWLPSAHTEAPTGGSVVLAALMLKLGGYGFLRFTLPIVPDASRFFSNDMVILALIGFVYISFVALVQRDMKRLIAYSSIAHMAFVVLASFLIFKMVENTSNLNFANMSLEGAMVQMIAHAFSSGAMFLAVGILAYRFHSRAIKDFGGIAKSMPILASFFMLFAMANVGLPGTAGFVGEFMIIVSAMQASFWISLIAGTTLILSAAYTLYMYKNVFFGKITHPVIEKAQDIHGTEILVFMFLGAVILFIGLYPAPLLNMMHTTISTLLQQSLQSKF